MLLFSVLCIHGLTYYGLVFNERCGRLRNADERGRDRLCGGFPMVSVVCWWTIVLLMGVARKVIFGPRLCLLVVSDWILGARWNRDTIWRQLDDEAGPGRIWASHRV